MTFERRARLAHLSWSEIAESSATDRTVALLPTAAIEQHGPHLPLDTDAFLCTRVAEESAARAQRDGPVPCPDASLRIVDAPHGLRGDAHARGGTFLAAVGELCSSLVEHGFRRLLVVNGHGGNSALAREAVQQLANRAPVLAASVDYWALAREAAAEVRDSPRRDGARLRVRDLVDAPPAPESVRRELVREIPEPRFSQERLELASPGPSRPAGGPTG